MWTTFTIQNGEVLSPCFLENSSMKITVPLPHFLQHTFSFRASCNPTTSSNLIPCSSYTSNVSKLIFQLSLLLFMIWGVCNDLFSFFCAAVEDEDAVPTVTDEAAGVVVETDTEVAESVELSEETGVTLRPLGSLPPPVVGLCLFAV